MVPLSYSFSNVPSSQAVPSRPPAAVAASARVGGQVVAAVQMGGEGKNWAFVEFFSPEDAVG